MMRRLVDGQQALAMNDSSNRNDVFINSIDDSIAISEPFTNTFIKRDILSNRFEVFNSA